MYKTCKQVFQNIKNFYRLNYLNNDVVRFLNFFYVLNTNLKKNQT